MGFFLSRLRLLLVGWCLLGGVLLFTILMLPIIVTLRILSLTVLTVFAFAAVVGFTLITGLLLLLVLL